MALNGKHKKSHSKMIRIVPAFFPALFLATAVMFAIMLASPNPTVGMGTCFTPPCDEGGTDSAFDAVYLERLDMGAHGPTNVAVDPQGRFYITDPPKDRLFITDANGEQVQVIDLGFYPAGIAVGIDGRIYLGDVVAQAVHVWDARGFYLFALGDSEQEFGWPNDIALDNSSGNIYVADSMGNQIKVYDSQGRYLFNITGPQEDPLDYPTGVAVDPDGLNVVVSDNNNRRLVVFDTQGNWLNTIGGLSRPQGLTIDDLGNIFAVDAFQSKVDVFSLDGVSLGSVGEFGTDPGQLRIPTDAVLDPYGRLAVVSYNNSVLELYGPQGYSQPPTQAEAPAISSLDFPKLVKASVVFFPRKLNLSSPGRWFRALIEPVDGSAADINVATVLLKGMVSAQPRKLVLKDIDGNGLDEMLVLFDRQSVVNIIGQAAGKTKLTITGRVGKDYFEATGKIEIAAPPDGGRNLKHRAKRAKAAHRH